MKFTFLTTLLLLHHLACGLTLDFTQDGNADPDGVPGPNDLTTESVTLPAIDDGRGGTIEVTISSSGGTINAADIGLGVEGVTGGRLDNGESLSLSFDRDIVIAGYTLEQFQAGEDSTALTPAEGPDTHPAATVENLGLPLVAGEEFTLSTLSGDGIRLASVEIDLATVLFRDSFARATQPSNDLDAEADGMTGTAAPVDYFESNDAAEGLSNIEGDQLHLADGPNSSQIHLDHNFVEEEILAEVGFAISFDIASNDGDADDFDRFIGFGIGLSEEEAASYGADFNATAESPGLRGAPGGSVAGSGVADWALTFRRNGTDGEENQLVAEIYQNGLLTATFPTFDSGTAISLNAPGQVQVKFALRGFTAGQRVIPIITWGSETIGAQADASFFWQDDNANFIGITARQNAQGWSVEDLSIAAVEVDLATEAVDDEFEVARNSPATTLDILANDLGFARAIGIENVSQPDHGTATLNGTSIDYTPATDYTGPDTFTYELGNGSTATVTVQVLPPAREDFFQVLQNSSENPLAVKRNDLTDGELVAVSSPENGTAEIDGETVNYIPSPDFVGSDTFTYTLSGEEPATVAIEVREFPNVVMIYADDQGWTSLEVEMDKDNPDSKSDYYLTPNLARFVSEGMRFSRGYSPAPNCSPSRYALLTGKTCLQLGFTDIVGRNLNPTPNTNQRLISPGKRVGEIQEEESTIPELLKSIAGANYTAAHFGKWHLNGNGPEAHGFDASDGATGNGEGNAGPASTPVDDPKLAYTLTQRASDWMDETEDDPFYLQVSHYAVHQEIQYSAASRALYDDRPAGSDHSDPDYGAMLTDLDTAVGDLLNHIDEQGIRHSTYVIYQADNGSPFHLSQSLPLRGVKPETWEGGIRVPTIIRGPGITADSQLDTPVSGIDFLPTIWDWAGQEASNLPANLDGGSLVPAITEASAGNRLPAIDRPGEIVAYTPHYVVENGVQQKDQRPRAVLVDGDYKLTAQFELGTIELYNLEERIEEDIDLADIETGKQWQLWVRLRNYMKAHGALYALPDPDNYPPADGIDDGDVDNDGLPDDWEMREMLSLNFDGEADTDGDGKTNAEEQQDGTDPLLPRALSIDTVELSQEGNLTLTWTSTPGVYQVEVSTDLRDWTPIETLAQNSNGQNFTATIAEDDLKRFYRIIRLP